MKVLFLTVSLGAGGTERVISMLVNDLADMGIDVELATLSSEETDFFRLPKSVKRHQLGGLKNSSTLVTALLNNVIRVRSIACVIRNNKPTHVISFLPQLNVLTVIGAAGKKCNVIVAERNLRTADNLPGVWQILRRLTYPHAEAVTVNSTEMKFALEGMLGRRIEKLDNPLEILNEGGVFSPRERLIISAGRLVSQKGYDLLIRAFANSDFQKAGWKLVILGEGDERERLTDLIGQWRLEAQVVLFGLTDQIDSWLTRAALFVLTSNYEGTPNAALEAMAYELPVLATDTCGEMRYIIRDGVDGLLSPRREADVRQRLDWAYNHQSRLREIGRAGRKRVQCYERTEIAKKWVEMLSRYSF